MSDGKDLVPLKQTLPAQSTGAKKILSQVMDDALAIAKVLNKSSTKVENEKWDILPFDGTTPNKEDFRKFMERLKGI